MVKDFDSWNQKKKAIDSGDKSPLFHSREIWWCSLGVNIGVETDGQNNDFERPVLVIKKFNKDMALVLPLTRSKKDTPYHYGFILEGDRESSILVLSQLRLVSSKRLIRLMKKVPEKTFAEILNKITQYLNFK